MFINLSTFNLDLCFLVDKGYVQHDIITIPSTVKEINEYQFCGISFAKTVVIESGVTKIGANAFKNCGILEEIYIPTTVVEIETDVFSNNPNLKIYYEGNSVPETWNENWNSGNKPIYFEKKYE